MPTLKQNIEKWDLDYDWNMNGDEWSKSWGKTENLWWWVVFPRILNHIKCDTILEIAPGRGRFTQYLKDYCKKLVIVDLSKNCIDYCKNRFSDSSNIEYFVNDGKSLEMIQDDSLDFVFSFDSLVHAEEDVIDEYLKQLSNKMKKNGKAFLHHSNRASFFSVYKFLLQIKFPFITKKTHWRAKTVSADKFKMICERNGLKCISQELVNWGGKFLIDSLSTFIKTDDLKMESNKILKNYDFMKNSDNIKMLSKIY